MVLLTVSVFMSDVSVAGFTVSTFTVVSACLMVSMVEAESVAESLLPADLCPLHDITDSADSRIIKQSLNNFFIVFCMRLIYNDLGRSRFLLF